MEQKEREYAGRFAAVEGGGGDLGREAEGAEERGGVLEGGEEDEDGEEVELGDEEEFGGVGVVPVAEFVG